MKQLSGLDAVEDELDISTSIIHPFLFSAHHNLAEVSIYDGGAESLELSNELHKELLHEFVDDATESWLVEEGGRGTDPSGS